MNVLVGKSTVFIDEYFYEYFISRKWHVNSNGYVVWRGVDLDGIKKTIRLHRMVTQAPAGMDVDHIDGNRLNNTASNLRICTRAQNLSNKLSKGSYLDKRRQRWCVEMNIEFKKYFFGSYTDREEADHIYHDIKTQVLGTPSRQKERMLA
jgi:hypothetical protein